MRITLFSTVLATLVISGLSVLYLRSDSYANYVYHKQVGRISDRIREPHALAQATPSEREREAYRQLMSGLQTTIVNALWIRQNCVPEKVSALADDLDRSGGVEFNSLTGCLAVWARFEEACPGYPDYAWFVVIREMQDRGEVPLLKAGTLVWKPYNPAKDPPPRR